MQRGAQTTRVSTLCQIYRKKNPEKMVKEGSKMEVEMEEGGGLWRLVEMESGRTEECGGG